MSPKSILFTVAAISVVLRSPGKAGDPTPAQLSQQWQRAASKAIFRMREAIVDERSDRERTKRVECLIESLASKNQAPHVRGNARRGEDQTIAFPEDYDRSLQVPVYLAIKELLSEDEDTINLLLSHEGDERYAFSVNSYTDHNVTVSAACLWIAKQKLLAYEPELHVLSRSQFGVYPPRSSDSFQVWWSKNKARGLAVLQIEAIDAAIDYMVSVDGATASPRHPEVSRLPLNEFNRRRDANLMVLKAIRQYVVATGTPYRARILDDDQSCIFGLPWTSRRHNK
jgi:hypothetical protein